MTFWRLVLNNLSFHRRMHVAVALGVAAAVAVLTGALVVGDSVRGTLRDVALERLGCYDEALLTDRFFRATLAQELAATPGFEQHFSAAVPAIIVHGTVEYHRPDGRTARASGVTIIGCNRYFWPACRRDPAEMVPRIAGDQIAINAALAGPEQLGIDLSRSPGAEVLLRIGAESHIPADSPLGRKQGTVRSRTLAVGFVVPSRVLGNFSLRPNQQTPLCAFVDLATLQSLLDRPQRANAILLAGRVDPRTTSQRAWTAASESANQWLANHLRPTAADYGLTLNHVVVGDRAKPVLDYYNLTSDRMLLDRPVEKLADKYGDPVQPALTYLANDLQCGERHVPYSTITAIDPKKGFGPFQLGDALPSPDPSLKGRGVKERTLPPPASDLRPPTSHFPALANDEIVLTDWAADDLHAKPGDTIRVTYFDPETTHGEAQERVANFKLRGIVPLAAPDKPPLPTNDLDLAPPLAGVTDRKSITTWDPPFPFHPDRVRPSDERYWRDHRTTPKAYVSLATGRRLWGSRFGQTTSLRFPGVPGAPPQSDQSKTGALPQASSGVLDVNSQSRHRTWASRSNPSSGRHCRPRLARRRSTCCFCRSARS
ncbi:MAG: hypothetical protein K8T25_01220 [Planctomycetia bacterium]|nr:hypothetical protein [Planctomycetia bacterium]